jgi:hypothetical protein
VQRVHLLYLPYRFSNIKFHFDVFLNQYPQIVQDTVKDNGLSFRKTMLVNLKKSNMVHDTFR